MFETIFGNDSFYVLHLLYLHFTFLQFEYFHNKYRDHVSNVTNRLLVKKVLFHVTILAL